MREVSIVSAVRTPVCRRGREYKNMNTADLAALPLRESILRAGLAEEEVDQVIYGCAFQQGENAYLARSATLKAGLPTSIPAFTPNSLCSSGLLSVILATQTIQVGKARTIAAGGVELVSQVPYLVSREKDEVKDGVKEIEFLDTIDVVFTDPSLKQRVGCTGENLAYQYGITRTDQDAYALRSHTRALKAMREGYSQEEIIPVANIALDDTGPKEELTMERLARYKPAFREGGSVTAGNSSIPADGAAGMIVMDKARAVDIGITPRVTIKDYCTVALEPERMGMAAAKAIAVLLESSGLKVQDIDLFEITESFAAQMLAVGLELKLDWRKVNTQGGTLAYGHPLGASGTIQLVRLIHALERCGGRYGIASCCAGGGVGAAIMVERS